MNKNYSLKSIVALSGIVISSITMANTINSAAQIITNPVGQPSDIYCPSTQGTTNVVTNFGSYIAGFGTQFSLSNNQPIYFKSGLPAPGTPRKLLSYFNESIDYDSTTGNISCTYASNNFGEPPFSVDYLLTNGRGGIVVGQSNNSISLIFQIGFKKS